MNNSLKYLLLSLILIGLTACNHSKIKSTQILIAGGGASGFTAAIQAARIGQQVLVVEPTPWLGGMLTAAGVSAIDGNHYMPSGLWGEFRQQLYNYYGGPDSVSTGWVSHTLFEPHVGNQIINKMVDQEPNIQVKHGYHITNVSKKQNHITSVTFTNEKGKSMEIQAEIYIDATEYGDLMARAGVPYHIGMESQSQTGEKQAPEQPNDYVQDLTYVATLKDYGPGADKTIPKPEHYDPSSFKCVCYEVCDDPDPDLIHCDKMLSYGRLPNDKYMINWPSHGNDYYLNMLDDSYTERERKLQAAKNHTLSFVYFLQTEGGYKNLGLADDEYPTPDRLPFIPYLRESRRMVGKVQLRLPDIKEPYANPKRPFFKSAIAVGDYPLDHHRKKNPMEIKIDFPPIPSFSVPYGTLIPPNTDNLIVAEKSISVSNLVNGATRLQPVVMELGQAAGAAAALSVQHQVQPAQVDIRELQQVLLDAGCWLMPYMDTQPDNPFFQSIQHIGLSGVMRGEGIPIAWENKTKFYPDSTVTASVFRQAMAALDKPVHFKSNRSVINWKTAIQLIRDKIQQDSKIAQTDASNNAPSNSYAANIKYLKSRYHLAKLPTNITQRPNRFLKRKQLAYLVDQVFDPFHKIKASVSGN